MTSYRNSDLRPAIMQGSPPQLVPPRMDWDRPPWNRWAFQNIRQILPTAEVWRGDGTVHALPRKEQDLDSLPVPSIKGSTTTLARLLDDTYTDGFIVLKDGAVVYERYFNGMTPRTLHLSQSVAKSVTAAAAGVLVGKGLLDVNAPVTHYIPELNDTAYRGALLQHVLDMRSGVTFDETYTDPHSDVGQLDVSSGWKPVPPGADPSLRWPRHVFEQVLGLGKLECRHGERFSYRSIETEVLGFCMERATGKRLHDIVSDELWQPMGAEQSASFTVDAFPGKVFDGKVQQVRKAAQTVSNVVTYLVEVSAANPELQLLPGMTANVRIVTNVSEGVLKVPNAALRFRPPQNDKEKSERKAAGSGTEVRHRGTRGAPGSARVYQLQAGKLVPLPVQLGASDGLMTEVTAPSLNEGSEVVIGTLQPADGKRPSPAMGGGPRMF